MSGNEGFLSRWSRRKHDSRAADDDTPPTESRHEVELEKAKREAAKPAAPPSPGVASGAPPAVVPGASSAAASGDSPADTTPVGAPAGSTPASSGAASGERAGDRPIELPSIDSLTPQSDFRPFMQVGVDATTRNAALAQLFRDPHFNVMDGLDVYIDDYNKTEPIPPTILAKLRQLHSIGLSDEEIERWTAKSDDAGEALARIDESGSPAGGAVAGEGKASAGRAPAADEPADDGEARAPGADEAIGDDEPPAAEPASDDEAPSAPIRVAHGDSIHRDTRREDAAAERNSQETDGEDQGSRL